MKRRLFFFEWTWFFNIFLSERSGKKTEISPFCLCQKTFEGFCLYIYHIYVFFRNYDSLFLHPELRNLHSEEAFRFEPFFLICLSFFPGHFLHSEWRNLHSEWRFLHFKLFHTRVMNLFFEMCLSFFFQTIFSIQNGEFSF